MQMGIRRLVVVCVCMNAAVVLGQACPRVDGVLLVTGGSAVVRHSPALVQMVLDPSSADSVAAAAIAASAAVGAQARRYDASSDLASAAVETAVAGAPDASAWILHTLSAHDALRGVVEGTDPVGVAIPEGGCTGTSGTPLTLSTGRRLLEEASSRAALIPIGDGACVGDVLATAASMEGAAAAALGVLLRPRVVKVSGDLSPELELLLGLGPGLAGNASAALAAVAALEKDLSGLPALEDGHLVTAGVRNLGLESGMLMRAAGCAHPAMVSALSCLTSLANDTRWPAALVRRIVVPSGSNLAAERASWLAFSHISAYESALRSGLLGIHMGGDPSYDAASRLELLHTLASSLDASALSASRARLRLASVYASMAGGNLTSGTAKSLLFEGGRQVVPTLSQVSAYSSTLGSLSPALTTLQSATASLRSAIEEVAGESSSWHYDDGRISALEALWSPGSGSGARAPSPVHLEGTGAESSLSAYELEAQSSTSVGPTSVAHGASAHSVSVGAGLSVEGLWGVNSEGLLHVPSSGGQAWSVGAKVRLGSGVALGTPVCRIGTVCAPDEGGGEVRIGVGLNGVSVTCVSNHTAARCGAQDLVPVLVSRGCPPCYEMDSSGVCVAQGGYGTDPGIACVSGSPVTCGSGQRPSSDLQSCDCIASGDGGNMFHNVATDSCVNCGAATHYDQTYGCAWNDLSECKNHVASGSMGVITPGMWLVKGAQTRPGQYVRFYAAGFKAFFWSQIRVFIPSFHEDAYAVFSDPSVEYANGGETNAALASVNPTGAAACVLVKAECRLEAFSPPHGLPCSTWGMLDSATVPGCCVLETSRDPFDDGGEKLPVEPGSIYSPIPRALAVPWFDGAMKEHWTPDRVSWLYADGWTTATQKGSPFMWRPWFEGALDDVWMRDKASMEAATAERGLELVVTMGSDRRVYGWVPCNPSGAGSTITSEDLRFFTGPCGCWRGCQKASPEFYVPGRCHQNLEPTGDQYSSCCACEVSVIPYDAPWYDMARPARTRYRSPYTDCSYCLTTPM